MRLLITGANGLLGLNLALEASRTHEIIGLDRGKLPSAPFRIIQRDLLDKDAVSEVLDELRPEAVIHCAAIADVDACEQRPTLAHLTNAELPQRLAEACARHAIRLIHISTDAVFGGDKQDAYVETDAPDPRGIYAITKLEGERAVLQAYPAATVARVNFYGWSLSGKRSLAEFFVNNLSRGSNVNGFTDVNFCPMFVGHLAGILMLMLPREMPGIYHAVGPQAMTKYQFGVEIARKFGLRSSLIAPQSVERAGLSAHRSHNLWLSTHKLSTELGLELPEFSTGLDAFHAQYGQGYPQKIRSYQQTLTGRLRAAQGDN
ncbi:MAG TPA: SDR family oxidoreductase [Anaerolineales bacterium]|nr:SDR family oxidoreductase [Anaerolineales bacterium]